jgi:hypothetical protein
MHGEERNIMTTLRNASNESAAVAAEPVPVDAPVSLPEPASPWPLPQDSPHFDRFFGPEAPFYDSTAYAAYKTRRARLLAEMPHLRSGVGAMTMRRLDAAAERLFWVAWERGIAHGAMIVQRAGPLVLREWFAGVDPVAGALAWLRFHGDTRPCAPEFAAYKQVLAQVAALDPEPGALGVQHPLTLLDEDIVAVYCDAWDFGVCIGANHAGLIIPDEVTGDLPEGTDIEQFALPGLAA